MSRLHQAIERDVERKLYDGAVTIVGVGGKVVFEEATGFGDRHAGAPMRLDSVFPVFSVSKAFNAVLVLQQIERGAFPIVPATTAVGSPGQSIVLQLSKSDWLNWNPPFLRASYV